MREVQPDELRGYTQHHFFAGIGGWAYALRLAGWPDDRPVLTGSPPCQPFSSAGKQLGVLDDRHLAPHFLALVAAVRPTALFGEQVAAAVNKDAWLDDLLDALENEGYATGAAVSPACGIGAPHIRQRLWFVGRLADASSTASERHPGGISGTQAQECREDGAQHGDMFIGHRDGGADSGLADTESIGRDILNATYIRQADAQIHLPANTSDSAAHEPQREQLTANTTRPLNSQWGNPDWLLCRDGKWRPVESGTFPLVNGLPTAVDGAGPISRVGALRGAGNAIVPQVAAEIVREVMNVR
jgi:DNA (cytosine-5)-methyltransferase 1